jgi:hypothetical protein
MPEMTVPTPPSAPMLHVGPQPETPLTLEPDPVNPEPDDIADPEVPDTLKTALEPPSSHQGPRSPASEPTAYDALLQGFCAHLLTRMQGIADTLTTTTQHKVVEHMHNYHAVSMGVQQEVCAAVKAWMEATTSTPGDHVWYQLSALLEKGIQIRHAPYRLVLQACAPQGYPVSFEVSQESPDAMLQELTNLVSWLMSQGYKLVG